MDGTVSSRIALASFTFSIGAILGSFFSWRSGKAHRQNIETRVRSLENTLQISTSDDIEKNQNLLRDHIQILCASTDALQEQLNKLHLKISSSEKKNLETRVCCLEKNYPFFQGGQVTTLETSTSDLRSPGYPSIVAHFDDSEDSVTPPGTPRR